jgi:Protein of unknown function (DUF1592)/Protein of unknown function (DUF1588)/Protein of unknown function (DUF1587)/Protein of unknown function (DUF1585)/Protein of unknown function (DUF1595)/Ca-dependent carbohydrate-binding module xylan-binding/Planctomycete cytochrome C
MMRSRRSFVVPLLLTAVSAGAVDYDKEIRPVLQEFCVSCHSAEKKKGDLNLEPVIAKPDFAKDLDIWDKVLELTDSLEMPPEKKPQPSDDARQKLIAWIESSLTTLASNEKPNPGRVTLRRLNKEEYRRTIYDLLKVDYQPEDFPNDEVGYGFNNIGDVLSLSPLLMEKYLAAAEDIAKKAIVAEPPKVPKRKLRGDRFESPDDYIRGMENHVLGLYREGEATAKLDFIRTGEYVMRVRAFGELAGPDAPKLEVKIGGKAIATFDVNTEKPKTYETRLSIEAGDQVVSLGFLNNYNDASNPDPKMRGDRNLFVDSVEIEGPFDGKPEPAVTKVEQSRWKLPEAAQAVDGKQMQFSSNGMARTEWQFPATDEYLIRVRGHGEQAGGEPAKVRVVVDGKELAIMDMTAGANGEDVRSIRATIEAGKRKLEVGFSNDYYEPSKNADRNLWIHGVEIVGPINASAPDYPQSHKLLITRMPNAGEEQAVAREILGNFAKRAYRRLVSDEEVNRLAGFVDLAMKNGGTFLEGIQTAVQATLCAPQFLFRWELDSKAIKAGDVRNLSDFEVASRLSYFLWSSMPDDELFGLAERGELLKDGNVEKQVARMIKDSRSRALVENFGGQWLQLHNIYEVDPDPKKFPKYSYQLREDMKRETLAFVDALIREDRSILDLVDARFTFLNERLARHYGIEGVQGNEFRRVDLPDDSPRGGVLTMGSILMATSMPTRTSPVIRGKWILEQILGTPPPPPPPNVPALEGAKNIDPNLPYKKRLEIHRDNPDCAGCHAKIDPLGFALENFDAIGAFRTMDGNSPVDAAGKLPNGTEFNGAADLKRVVKGDRFVHTVAENLMIYALGRGLERYDKRALETVMKQVKAGDYKFSTLITAVATSEPFLKRKTDEQRVAAN